MFAPFLMSVDAPKKHGAQAGAGAVLARRDDLAFCLDRRRLADSRQQFLDHVGLGLCCCGGARQQSLQFSVALLQVAGLDAQGFVLLCRGNVG